jgi:hypothetical protein
MRSGLHRETTLSSVDERDRFFGDVAIDDAVAPKFGGFAFERHDHVMPAWIWGLLYVSRTRIRL